MNIPVYVGYDEREPVGYHVFCQSILEKNKDVRFTPVSGAQRDGSNRFIYERFRVAEMCGFKGWAIFADGDMLCRANIKELWDLQDGSFDVLVAKHDYRTKHPVKYLGQRNEDYPRKNWSSVMLINCAFWKHVTEDYIDRATGKHLHRFQFLEDESIGELPKEWNWLVSEYPHLPSAKLVHFTIGLPCWPEYAKCDYADEWLATRDRMLYFAPSPEKIAA